MFAALLVRVMPSSQERRSYAETTRQRQRALGGVLCRSGSLSSRLVTQTSGSTLGHSSSRSVEPIKHVATGSLETEAVDDFAYRTCLGAPAAPCCSHGGVGARRVHADVGTSFRASTRYSSLSGGSRLGTRSWWMQPTSGFCCCCCCCVDAASSISQQGEHLNATRAGRFLRHTATGTHEVDA